MTTDKLNALASILYEWILAVPCHSAPGTFIFDLKEFQSYVKHATSESYDLQEIQKAVLLLASFRIIQLVEGWPSKSDENLLQLSDDGRFVYSYSYHGLGFL